MKRALIVLAGLLIVLVVGLLLNRSVDGVHSQFIIGFSRGTESSSDDKDWFWGVRQGQLSEALRTLNALELRDSLSANPRQLAVEYTQRLHVDVSGRAATPADVELFHNVLQREWRDLNLRQPVYPVIVSVHIDSIQLARFVGPGDNQFYEESGADLVFAPPTGAGRPCLTVVRIVQERSRPSDNTDQRARTRYFPSLGPCAYYAAFGAPGRGIQSWLEARQFDVARASWQMSDTLRTRRVRSSHQIMHPLYLPGALPPEGSKPQLQGSALQRCADGVLAGCRDLILLPENQSATGLVDHSRVSAGTNALSAGPLHSSASWRLRVGDRFLAALVANEGRERFATFWMSDAPAEVAFENAFGQPMGEWVRDWVHHTIGFTIRGTRVSVMSLVACVALLLAGLGIAAAVAAGRTVR